MLISAHLLSTFKLSSFCVSSGATSFSVGLVNVMCKIVCIHSELFWEDHFPQLLLSACHTCLCWLLFLYHIRPVLLVFTSQAFPVLYSPYLSSLLHYRLVDSCLQPASDTHIQHPLLKFSDKHLSLSPMLLVRLGRSPL